LQQLGYVRAGGKIMKMREEDIPEVSEESFRYSGLWLQTRESAIISLARHGGKRFARWRNPRRPRSNNW